MSALDVDDHFVSEIHKDANGDHVYFTRVVRPLPVSWALIAGDAIHNARAALDHLACRLVEVSGNSVTTATMFPFHRQEEGFGQLLKSKLHGVDHTTRAAVRELRPWKGGDDLLYSLHEMDIGDKHKLLLPVGAVDSGVEVTTALPTGVAISYTIHGADREFITEGGQEVFRIQKGALHTLDAPMQNTFRPSIEIAFGPDTPLSGSALPDALDELIAHASTVAEPLIQTVA